MKSQHTFLAIVFVGMLASWLPGQVIRPLRPFSTEGEVKQVGRGSLIMNDKAGRAWQLRYSGADGVVSLDKNRKFAAPKPVIEVSGSLGQADIKADMVVQFECYVSDKGSVQNPVAEVKWIDSKVKPGMKINKKKSNDDGAALCLVTGTVDQVDAEGFMVRIPRSRLASKGMLTVPLAKDVKLLVKSRDVTKAREGDAITEVRGVELTTGDFVIQKLVIRLVQKTKAVAASRKRKQRAATTIGEVLESKYEQLSDDPVAPRTVRDPFVWITTDLSDRKTRMLLDDLRDELGLLTGYFRRQLSAPIECYVVADIQQWTSSKLPADVGEAINNKATKLVPQTGSNGARFKKVKIYAPSSTKGIRADLVRAYCYQAFGGLGPDWYSEGMAEVGKYWKDPVNEVNVDPDVLKILTKAKESKPLKEIINPTPSNDKDPPPSDEVAEKERVSRDAQAAHELAAHRWALCYMLVHNPNYRGKFLELGTGLMMERDVSLTKTYGKVSKQLSFELAQFTKNVSQGYRMDLSAWRWSHRFKKLDKSDSQQFAVQAKQGWQPAVLVEKDISYDLVAKGKWQIDGSGTETTGDGDEKGVGKLVAAIMTDDYQLTEPIPIGKSATFVAPASGRLYLRCDEKWGGLADNSGKLTASIRQTKAK